MAISRIAGQMLQTNLERDGVNLSFSNLDLGNSTPVLYLDVANNRVGINRSGADVELDLVGNFRANGNIQSYSITATGNVLPSADITYDLGDPSYRWNNLYANIITANISSPGGNTEIVFNDGGILGAAPGLTFDKVSNAFSVSGNVVGANVETAGLVTATGNITGGNIITGGLITATGNITSAANIEGANLLTGGLITATGNVTGGNINTGGVVSALGNVISPVIVTTTVTTNTGNLTLDSAGGSLQWTGTGNVVFNSQWINNLSNPNQAKDAATKQYVDDAVSAGIHIHTPVDVETPVALPSATYAQGGTSYTVNQTIAGNVVVFSTAANLQINDQLWFSSAFEGIQANVAYFVVSTPNTSAAVLSTEYNGAPVSNITSNASVSQSVLVNSGIGATLTATANGALTIDGFAVSAGNRVLVYNQVNQYENGVYSVTDAGNVSAPWILTRATDSDTYIPDTNDGLDQGSYFYVKYGNTGAGESYVLTQPTGPFIIGLANIEFTQFSASQVYSANTAAGINLSGTIFSAKVDNDTTAFDGGGNIAVKPGANLVTPNIGNATGNSLTLTGNGLIQAANISVTGNVDGGNINTVGLVTATGNVTGGNINTAGLVTATGNITGGNITTAGEVTSTGNVTGGNLITAGLATVTGNVIGGNLETAGEVTATGNVTGGNLVTTGLITATGNITGGNIDTSGAITATGNVTGGNLITAGVVTATGNITGGNIETAGAVTATGNVTGGNITTAGEVTATGNVIGGNLVTSGVVTATGNVETSANLIVSGYADITGNLTVLANISGGNILTSGLISATGNVTGGNILTAGDVSATGNLYGDHLTTQGNALIGGDLVVQGNITYINVEDLQVEDPIIIMGTGPNGAPLVTNDGKDRGIFMEYYTTGIGNAFVGWDNSTGNMIIASDAAIANDVITVETWGTLQAGNLHIESLVSTGNIAGGNLLTGGLVSATGNVTGGNITTPGVVTATGNVETGSNLIVAGYATVTGNVTGGNLLTGGQITATGNITGGNIDTAGLITATGNVTGGNLVTSGLATVTGNVIGGNITTAGEVTATGNVTGGNLVTSGLATVTGNVIGGNIETAGEVTATGNVTGGNLVTAGLATVTGNVIGGNIETAGSVTATGNVTGGNITTAGEVTATGNVTGGNLVTAGLATVTGNVIGGNIETAGEVTATGNVTGGNLITSGFATVTGNITGGNIATAGEVSATGNITGGNLITSGSISTTGNLTGGNLLTSGVVSATGNITGGNIDTAGTATANNLIAYTLTSTGELGLYSGSSGNIIIDPNGTGMLQIVGTNGFVIPTGNTAQRPSPADTGTLRYNTEYDRLEVYDGTEWDSVVSDVTNQVIVPDGSSLNYTLDREATAPSVLVSINGLIQIPGIAYAYTVTGNTITFAEAPLTTDIIDIRFL